MAKLEPYHGHYYLWEYLPSIPAAVIFTLLFMGTTAFHFWKLWKTRARFCIPFAIGGLFEVIGYIGRAASHDKTALLGPYIVQSIFILLGPVLFAASVYMVLGRLIRSIQAEKYSVIRLNWLTKIFVASDLLSFLVQGSGAGLMATGSSSETGNNIVIGGLMIQVVMFGLFMVTSFVFELRMNRGSRGQIFETEVPWKTHLHVLLGHEWTLYIFDALLMGSAMVIWAVWHPSTIWSKASEMHVLAMTNDSPKH